MPGFLNTFKSLDATSKIMNLISQNQVICTNNISNYQTPEYVKKNTNFDEVMGTLRDPMLTDLGKEMGPCPLLSEPDGKVHLEEELMNMQKNFTFYSMASRRAASLITTIKSVAQAGR